MIWKFSTMSDHEARLSRRAYTVLFVLGLLVFGTAASLQRAPGYMDADYYYAGALRIISGEPASEPYLWNYLNDPASLPAPSFSYWMPLPSLLAALGLSLARPLGFWAAQMGFILLAACIPLLTAMLGARLTGSKRMGLFSGLLAVFPGFYLPFLTVTDAFPLFMVLGGLFLLNARQIMASRQMPVLRFVLLGLTAGLLHMSRADGLLWLGAAALTILFYAAAQGNDQADGWKLERITGAAVGAALVLMGYALVTAPWYLHNLNQWGALMPPGSARAMWITEYEQTMIYPAQQLNAAHWLAAGWTAHLQARLSALSGNLQTALAVQGGIVLFPFVLLGLWRLRSCIEVRLGVCMWLVSAAVMTLVFPFAGINGGFFHSGAGVQPLLWAAAPVGLEQAARWYAGKRRLRREPLLLFVSGLMLAVSVLLSGLIYYQRVVGDDLNHPRWSAGVTHYRDVEAVLREQGAADGEPVLVNNPPGYWLASSRSAAVIPYGDESALIAAARRYHAGYIVLEINNPHQLADFYHGRTSPPELQYIASIGQTKLYRVLLPGSTR